MRTKDNGHLMVFGVAVAALMGVFLGSSILVPAESASADDTASAEINVRVNPIIAITTEGADEDGKLKIEVDRASGLNMGTGKVDVKVSTNDPDGYTLYINTDKADTTLSQDGVTDRIKALAGETKKAAFPENSWGYSLDGGAIYYPVQPSTENPTEYPEKVTTAVGAKTYGSATTENLTEVTIGAKVKDTLPSGSYGNTIVFTAVPNTNILWATEEIEGPAL